MSKTEFLNSLAAILNRKNQMDFSRDEYSKLEDLYEQIKSDNISEDPPKRKSSILEMRTAKFADTLCPTCQYQSQHCSGKCKECGCNLTFPAECDTCACLQITDIDEFGMCKFYKKREEFAK